jgi:hypothetical protein
LTKWLKYLKWRQKSVFFVIVSKLQILTNFKNLDCIRVFLLLSNFCRKIFFSKKQKGGFFEDDVIFEKKSTFLQKGPPTLAFVKKPFFKFSKSNLVVQRPKINQTKPKKIFQDGRYFQNGVCTFFLYENMSCDRYFRSIVLIFGLSHYFLRLIIQIPHF